MAGIGFALRRLATKGDLLSMAGGYVQAAFVAVGPWLFTICALVGIEMFGSGLLEAEDLRVFRTIVSYNFSFSLTASGPVVFIVTRYLANRIYEKRVEEGPAILIGSLALVCATQAPVGIVFYGILADLDPMMRWLAVINELLVGTLWVAAVFLTALKDFRSISAAFALGMVVSLVAGAGLSDYGPAGLLFGFSAGLAVVLFAVIALIFAEYPYRLVRPFAFLPYFRIYWPLACFGAFYNAGSWIDKWVMWWAPESEIVAGVMRIYPGYDTAMFLAYFTTIPAMVIFLVNTETTFFERYISFYRNIERHGTLDLIEARFRQLQRGLARGLRNVMVLQAAITYGIILFSPRILDFIGIPLGDLGILRFGVLGAYFHTLFLFLLIVLAYFDLRPANAMLSFGFMLLNGLASWLSLGWGEPYYGYGYFIASLVMMVTAFGVVSWYVGRLPYLTFIANNPSVQIPRSWRRTRGRGAI